MVKKERKFVFEENDSFKLPFILAILVTFLAAFFVIKHHIESYDYSNLIENIILILVAGSMAFIVGRWLSLLKKTVLKDIREFRYSFPLWLLPFWIIGWITVILSPILWVVAIIIYLSNDKETLHYVTTIWGFIVAIIGIIIILFATIFL